MKRTRLKSKSQNRHRVRFRLVPTLIICGVLAVVGSSVWQILILRSHVEEQLAQLNQQKVLLLNEEKRLKEEIVQLNTPSYIEQLAREQLGLVKHGEILISPKN